MRDTAFLVVDVGPAEDYERAHIPGAVSIPRSQLWSRLGGFPEDHDTPILVYDLRGERSGGAAQMILDDGYNRVYELRGGLKAWMREGFPVVPTWGPGVGLAP